MGREGFVLKHHTKLKRNEKKYLSQQTMIAKCLKEVKKQKTTTTNRTNPLLFFFLIRVFCMHLYANNTSLTS